jgi:hypothetical protein
MLLDWYYFLKFPNVVIVGIIIGKRSASRGNHRLVHTHNCGKSVWEGGPWGMRGGEKVFGA